MFRLSLDLVNMKFSESQFTMWVGRLSTCGGSWLSIQPMIPDFHSDMTFMSIWRLLSLMFVSGPKSYDSALVPNAVIIASDSFSHASFPLEGRRFSSVLLRVASSFLDAFVAKRLSIPESLSMSTASDSSKSVDISMRISLRFPLAIAHLEVTWVELPGCKVPLVAQLAEEGVHVLALCDIVRFGLVEITEHLRVVRALPRIPALAPLPIRHSVAELVCSSIGCNHNFSGQT